MHLTQEADNAVRIVYCLAAEDRRRDAKYISEKIGVSLQFSLKILRKLVASGVLRSYKGNAGGYELARPPREITLNDVVETVDGPCAFNRCLRANHECTMDDSEACGFKRVCADISKTITNMLSAVTFDQLM